MENISQHRFTDGKANLPRHHQAHWDEPIIMELSQPGERGILLPETESQIASIAGDVLSSLPAGMRRQTNLDLPEMSQLRVLRHYTRISQENMGVDVRVDLGQGTCTMKYNPKINEALARSPRMTELHPLQDESTVQGILEVMYRFEEMLKEISGMDRISLQPRGGSSAIYANAAVVRAFHEEQGEGDQRDEIITTIFSHPSDAAAAKVAGYKIITIYPDADGYPDLEALNAALSNRTAALFITNPEDTGIFNPKIKDFVDATHEAGGLCVYDQANANGLLGITRARDAGFDLCHFNLHKTFSTPHACGGPAVGAMAVSSELKKYLPGPLVDFDGENYKLVDPGKNSIGKVGMFHGAGSIVLRAYAWVMSMGSEGLREVSDIAVLNNNYLMHHVLKIKGISAPYAEGKRRIEQVRYSLEELFQDTGISSEQIAVRMADYGMHLWPSHHPYVVPQPATLEPTEAYSRTDIDDYVKVLAHVCGEAYSNPEIIRTAPHNVAIHQLKDEVLDSPDTWSMTWRGYQRKLKEHGLA